jgi:hypothetical protein
MPGYCQRLDWARPSDQALSPPRGGDGATKGCLRPFGVTILSRKCAVVALNSSVKEEDNSRPGFLEYPVTIRLTGRGNPERDHSMSEKPAVG